MFDLHSLLSTGLLFPLASTPSSDRHPAPTAPQPIISTQKIKSEVSAKGLLLDSVPLELVHDVFTHLDRSSIVSFSRCSKAAHRAAFPFVWQSIQLEAECPQMLGKLDRLNRLLQAHDEAAKAVRFVAVTFGAGELSTGQESHAVGRLLTLLPGLQHLDLRADSMGRYRGRLDPIFDQTPTWTAPALDTVVLKGLIHSPSAVVEFLRRHPSIKRASLGLTQLSVEGQPRMIVVGQGDWATLEPDQISDERWDLSPACFPISEEPLLPNLVHLTAPLFVASSLLHPDESISSIQSLDLQLGHFQNLAAREKSFRTLSSILSLTPSLKSLRLSGGISPTDPLVDLLASDAEQLEVLDLMDSFGFVHRLPGPCLSIEQRSRFPKLRYLKLRVWGYFALSYSRGLPSSSAGSDSSISLRPSPEGVERVSLSTITWRVDLKDEQGQRRTLLEDVERRALGDAKVGDVFGEKERFVL